MDKKINDPLIDLTIERKFGGSVLPMVVQSIIGKVRLPWNRIVSSYQRYFLDDPISTEMSAPVRRFSDGQFVVLSNIRTPFSKEILQDLLYECFPWELPKYYPCPHCGKERFSSNPYFICEHCQLEQESEKIKEKLFKPYTNEYRSPF